MVFVLPMLTMSILSVFGLVGFEAMMYAGITVLMLTQILYVVVFYKIGLALITKRCRDFGSDGKTAILIYKVQMALTVANIILL